MAINFKIDTVGKTALKVMTGGTEPIESTDENGNTVMTYPPMSGTHFDIGDGAVMAIRDAIIAADAPTQAQIATATDADGILTAIGFTVSG